MRAEKRAEREKKMEERKKELESWRDQRSPTEDMELTDHKALPVVPRIPNLKLSGKVRFHWFYSWFFILFYFLFCRALDLADLLRFLLKVSI